jgi:hypothetical protein
MTNRALPDEAEAIIVQFIRSNFVALGLGFDRLILKSIVLMFIHSMVAEGFLDDTALNFRCSNYFLSAFLRRQNLSFRRVRTARRPQIDDQECATFMIQIAKVSKGYSEFNIVNFDESFWHPVMASGQVVGERGAEVVQNYTDGDAKASFSFFASICADGTKLPLILIVRGKTR